jgi:hypothetical protein
VKLAAKQLLALGVHPTLIRELGERADLDGLELRQLVQYLLRDGLHRESLALELEAEKHNHKKDNTHLVSQRDQLLSLAEHLWQMIPREVWRDHGAEWMGHYEGDFHAEKVREELAAFRAERPHEPLA